MNPMELINSVASTATAMQALQFQQSYALAVTKKGMEVQELAGQELVKMLPQQPPMPAGASRHLDVYA